MFSKTFSSERILLRPYETGDISSWQKWDVDPEVQRFLPGPQNPPESDEQTLVYFKECEDEQDGYYWSIVWKENNQLIGTISLTEINSEQATGELGLIVGEKEYWGRGVAQESLRLLTSLLPDLGIHRINAEFEEGNIALEKALIKAGFQKEAELKASRTKSGQPINTVKYFYI